MASTEDQRFTAADESGAPAVIDRIADAVDDRVPDVDDVGNEVLPDESRTIRWAGLLFTVCAVVLVPWIVVIAITLPSRQLSSHYDIAWAGFDGIMFLALGATALSALRRSRHLAMTASWSAALLVTDAWFDVLSAATWPDRIEAILLAALVELPLAATCVWLTRHAEDIAEQRLILLSRRSRRLQTAAGAGEPRTPAG